MKKSFSRRRFIATSALGTGGLLAARTIDLDPAAVAFHMANESYFRVKTVYWDDNIKNIKA